MGILNTHKWSIINYSIIFRFTLLTYNIFGFNKYYGLDEKKDIQIRRFIDFKSIKKKFDESDILYIDRYLSIREQKDQKNIIIEKL